MSLLISVFLPSTENHEFIDTSKLNLTPRTTGMILGFSCIVISFSVSCILKFIYLFDQMFITHLPTLWLLLPAPALSTTPCPRDVPFVLECSKGLRAPWKDVSTPCGGHDLLLLGAPGAPAPFLTAASGLPAPSTPAPTCSCRSTILTFVGVLERREGAAARGAGEVGRRSGAGSCTCKGNPVTACSPDDLDQPRLRGCMVQLLSRGQNSRLCGCCGVEGGGRGERFHSSECFIIPQSILT